MSYATETEARMLVVLERERQTNKWGLQTHDNGTWAMILTEEVGELSQACLTEVQEGELTKEILQHQIDEAVQTTAVALSWLSYLMTKRNQFNG